MAIKVSGTTVINDSRGLQNVASVDATTAASITAAGVGGGGAKFLDNWDPSATPDQTFTSSGTWTKPGGVSDDTWVVFYLVGGGCGGAARYENTVNYGGSATFVTGMFGDLPSSITVTIGAGGPGLATLNPNADDSEGSDTTISTSDRTFTAKGGFTSPRAGEVYWPSVVNPFGTQPSVTNTTAGDLGPGSGQSPGYDSTYGGGGGAASQWSNNYGTQIGGVSTYAGNGGNSPYSSNGTAGTAPGGGGGNVYQQRGSTGGAGANGSVRVYYLD